MPSWRFNSIRIIIIIATVVVLLFVAINHERNVSATPEINSPIAGPPASDNALTSEEAKPGTIMIVTFVNGTTKAIRTDSTNIQTVDGGYFIADSSVKASQPLQPKTVSKTVVQQLIGIFVNVRIDDPLTSSEGCAKGWGYHVGDPSPICEPVDKIGEGPPPNMAFCAALGCPYNPPALPSDSSPEPVLEPSTEGKNCGIDPSEGVCLYEPQPGDPDYPSEPVASQPLAEPEPEPEREPAPGNGNENQNEEESQNEDGDGGSNDSQEGEGDSSGDGESEE